MALLTIEQIAKQMHVSKACLQQRINTFWKNDWPEPKGKSFRSWLYDEDELNALFAKNPYTGKQGGARSYNPRWQRFSNGMKKTKTIQEWTYDKFFCNWLAGCTPDDIAYKNKIREMLSKMGHKAPETIKVKLIAEWDIEDNNDE